ncbi:MAG: valine--tRNA ligase [Thermotogae bacterium]|nr:valine--tRNA ligase [Thermotogota bacterium]MCP5465153.1 valine--tRNA ligase [Thermotogota bacterium]HOO74018.1 valine--tRNA ligase [Tepiditoga sp.]
MDIGKRYMPHELEEKWYKTWTEKKAFEPSKKGEESFTIVIPPPNITGKLHMGHALNITIQDILTRYKRMQGYDTLWLPGEDHAGIATQHVVEKHLKKTEGKRRQEYGREEFLGKVWDWANEYRDHIRKQLRALGASVDWSRERFTLDDGLNRAVNKVFLELYNEGLIYKGKYIVNWCPSCGTVLSDDEVEHEDDKGKLYHIRYYFKDREDYIIIATTRPETMLGDIAIAVHPSDERYKDIVGEKVILPLVGREIEIIADAYVDPAFGTGMVKITPAHDPNDYQIGLRHNLERIQVIGENGKMNENALRYEGMDRYEAREEIMKDLEEQGFVEKTEDHDHSVGHCYRCHTVVEPFLMDQWFVKMAPLAEKAVKSVQEGETVFHPNRWEKVYLNWMDNIRDWCISRQLWWGHRIPVWYCQECGHVNVAESRPDKCSECGSENLKQDEDVLDTWFSSALWPFSTLGWPEKSEDLERFYPTGTLVTAFDIIFFWVARMIMMGDKFMGKAPFKDVYITPLVRDKQGRKMSKSLGNGIDPLDIISEFGTDPLRFSLTMLAAQGKDIKLDPKVFDSYSKFANKIWNAVRFMLLNMDDFKQEEIKTENLNVEDKWILTRMQKVIKEVTQANDSYDFNQAAKALYEFFWNELCDWYIEAVKDRLKSENEKSVAQNVLVYILDNSLRLLHPYMPYLTEELWQSIPVKKDTEFLINASWPVYDEKYIFEEEEKTFIRITEFVRGLRNVKAEMNIPNIKTVEINIKQINEDKWYEKSENLIKNIGFVDKITLVDSKQPKSATFFVDESVEAYVILGMLIDVEAEKQILGKKISKAEKDVEKYDKKLMNKNFTEKAEPEIVEETKVKLEEAREQYRKLNALLKEL